MGIDVLAVMGYALGDVMAAKMEGFEVETKAAELSASIAAVAELIEAGRRLRAADLKVSDLKEFGGHEYMYKPEWRESTVDYSNAWCSFGNILARVTGGDA